jgi:integrase/recombinase XerD
MKVRSVILSNGAERYVVVDNNDQFVVPIVKYLRYLDSIGRARNTLRAYAHHLCLYFEFLDKKQLNYEDVTLHDMGNFVLFLKNPYRSVDLAPRILMEQARSNHTINLILTACSGMYDYWWRQDGLNTDLNVATHEEIPKGRRSFKSFLHHLDKDQTISASVLRQKTRSKRPKTLTKEQIVALMAAANNSRDRLLIYTLYDASLRIGEMLALWLEDIDIGKCTLSICYRSNLVNGAEIKTPASIRTVKVTRDLMNEISRYVSSAHSDEIETNHVFLKLRGPHAGKPLSYPEVSNLFTRLHKKTGIDATAHVLRHSSATELWRAGVEPEILRIRLGHAHYQTTVQLYVHPSEGDLSDAFDRVQDAIALKSFNTERENES